MAINWREVNFDWNHARAFLVTMEEGSLSAAARALNLTQPTLSRQVAALEEELGLVLFERVGRGLEPTPSGIELAEHVRLMGEAANQLSLTASGQSNAIGGKVCISCTDLDATFRLPKIVKSLREEYPSIQIEIIASNDASDLKGREADIAIRGFRPQESDLIAKKLYDIHATLYATSEYLDSICRPKKKQEFSKAQFIGFHKFNQEYIDILNEKGIEVDDKNFAVLCNNHLTYWEITKLGMGIGVMPVEIGDNESLVERVIQDKDFFKGEVWLVAHRELRTSRRVKTVFEYLSKSLVN
ncbi:MAG: LysR family transcriptional regulator [Kangiellaceae bacterium]|nr:LysR family transcriptional regulator [Kangiellaceae bacterium]MCW8998343.1 LysR family transcriptional regulator [Kangiellaceae bacterium]MCW9015730.1 LysR family transcriptional regulator [Kangiellaceae bacterium]